MARNILRTGKQTRPKTAVKGKRYRCARCRKRSVKPVKTPAPWYCPKCANRDAVQAPDIALPPPALSTPSPGGINDQPRKPEPENRSWEDFA
jgi:late competence protein required for DNA uptake (superfamily II DNA/RNA helicase)